MTYIEIINEWNSQSGIEKTWEQLSEAEKVQFAYTLGVETVIEKCGPEHEGVFGRGRQITPSMKEEIKSGWDRLRRLKEGAWDSLEDVLKKGKSAAVLFSEQFMGKWEEVLKKEPGTILIQDWAVCYNPRESDYLAPELRSSVLTGKVFGHPRIENGTQVTTSSIVGLKGDLIVTKSGSLYMLGNVDAEYEKAYPNAKERIIASIKLKTEGSM